MFIKFTALSWPRHIRRTNPGLGFPPEGDLVYPKAGRLEPSQLCNKLSLFRGRIGCLW